MDKGFKQLGQIKSLLSQALGVAQHHMPGDRSVVEAKSHIKRAITEIDKVSKTKLRKEKMTNSQFETWWGNVQSGTAAVAHSAMSPEAQQKSLAQLNGMIAEEQKKLDDLDKKASEIENRLLKD